MKKLFAISLLFFLTFTLLAQQRASPTAEAISAVVKLSRSDLAPKNHIKQRNTIPSEESFIPTIHQNNIIPMSKNGTMMSDLNSDENFIYLHLEGYDQNIKNVWQNDFKIDSVAGPGALKTKCYVIRIHNEIFIL